jgi:serine/threonine protein kinase
VQSDIYAYGMFLYEVLTHHFPFEKFVTECPDGSLLSLSKQHWSLHDLHKKGNDQNQNLLKRCASKAATNLCIPEEIKRDCPVGYVELLKNCISVRSFSSRLSLQASCNIYASQHNASERPQSMEDVRRELERIRTDLLASSVPAGSTRVMDIPVHFSEEQIAVMSHVLGTDLTGSSNVTSSIHTLIVSQTLSLTSDHFERKHEPPADAGLAARVESDSH